jgi:hypothetical protein
MARGRMISKSLSTSEKFANLSLTKNGLAEFCQVLYVMLIPHTDDFGRLQGDVFTIKHQCFPASPRPPEDFKTALSALHDAELIIWYQVSGKQFLQITNFDPHQSGLHKRTKSHFPDIPGNSGNVREIPSEEKGRELKGTEGKGRELVIEKHCRPALKTPSDVPAALAHYQAGYTTVFHEKPNINGSKDGALLKKLLKSHGLEAVKGRIDNMFHSKDAFIRGSGCTIGILSSQWNKLRTTESNTGKTAGNLAALTRFANRKTV